MCTERLLCYWCGRRNGRFTPSVCRPLWFVGRPAIYATDWEEGTMQITISGHHVDLTDPLKAYVHSKLERLNTHSDLITSIHVTLTVVKLDQKADAVVHVNGKDLFADATELDMYAAIDSLTDKLDRQLIKHKEKLRSHR